MEYDNNALSTKQIITDACKDCYELVIFNGKLCICKTKFFQKQLLFDQEKLITFHYGQCINSVLVFLTEIFVKKQKKTQGLSEELLFCSGRISVGADTKVFIRFEKKNLGGKFTTILEIIKLRDLYILLHEIRSSYLLGIWTKSLDQTIGLKFLEVYTETKGPKIRQFTDIEREEQISLVNIVLSQLNINTTDDAIIIKDLCNNAFNLDVYHTLKDFSKKVESFKKKDKPGQGNIPSTTAGCEEEDDLFDERNLRPSNNLPEWVMETTEMLLPSTSKVERME